MLKHMKKKKKTHLGPKRCFWICLGLFLSFCPLLPLHSLYCSTVAAYGGLLELAFASGG